MKRAVVAAILLLGAFASAMMVAPSHAGAGVSMIRGTVYGYDQSEDLYPLSWVNVTATGVGGSITASSATDGTYMMWVAPGTYNVTASSDPGFLPQANEVSVTAGGVATADFYLHPSGKPIPEYPSPLQPAMLIVAALATVIMIRRRQRALPARSK